MAKRRALIVDDSKTAQIRLRKMLERFELEVDTVLSAEEALGYLSYRQPAVLFLDHHMEGMDGLEALKIIKTNPSTALIPVIMYTSEKGDVYVGQARALGAMDIIGKGTIKHENLEKVLNSLGIAENAASKGGAGDAAKQGGSNSQATTPKTMSNSQESPSEKSDFDRVTSSGDQLSKVQLQISRLFEIHIAKVRQEIGDSTKFLLRRLAKDEKAKLVSKKTVTEPQTTQNIPTDPVVVQSESSGLPTVFLGMILLGIAFLGYHLYINNHYQELQYEQYQELLARTQAQENLMGQLITQVSKNSSTRDSAEAFAERQVLLDALSWAVNVNTQVEYGSRALTDQRIYMLGELLALLTASNFKGEVYLDVHKGNFCVVQDLSGGWILPEPESNVEECRLLDSISTDVRIQDQVSLGFLNYVHSAPILVEGSINVEMSSRGYDEPQVSYPPITSGTSAGEWNAAALKNNRISISFSAN